MNKKILSQLMILSFAFAGLFLVGNNVLGNGGSTGDLDDQPAIKCTQIAGPGALCWSYDSTLTPPCNWSGYAYDACLR